MSENSKVFADLLHEFMWSQRPPWNAVQLAAHLGVGRQTVYNWLNRGTKPQLQFLPLIAEKTSIPLRDLYEAAGYPPPSTSPIDAGVWAYIAEGVVDAPDLDEATKERVVRHIAEMRARYETRHDRSDASDASLGDETCRASTSR